MSNFIKKAFSVSVVVATIFWAVGFAAFVPVAASAASEGDLIKMEGNSSVYYYAGGKRYVFPNESTYFSWYSDFSSVVTISASELQAIPLGDNVVIRPGTKLVKITTDPKVYAVSPNGTLHHIDSEARAIALFGADWATRVVDVPDAFFTNYEIGDAIDSDTHPEGSLIKYEGSSEIYWINGDGEKQAFSSMDAFDANRFKLADVVTVDDSISYPDGEDITGAISSVTDTSQGAIGTGNGGDGGSLTVSLASDSPSATQIPAGVSVHFGTFNLKATGGDVEITTLTMKASGLGTATYMDSVTLYAGGTKVSTSKNVNSEGKATFNFADPIDVTSGTTKELDVWVTIESSQSGFFAIGVENADAIGSDASSVSGSFPVNSATMQAEGGVTVGQLTFDASDNDTTANVGADDVSFVEFTAEASSTEDVWFQGITLRNNGNMRGDDLGMIYLYHDGNEIDSAVMDNEKYVSFSFDAIEIESGQTESFEVRGDIDGGNANDTIQLYIKDDADVNAVGDLYGYQTSVVKTAFDTDDGDSTEITIEAGQLNINFNGTEVPAADIQIDKDNIVFGLLEITAPDEAIRITGLTLTSEGAADGELENAELKNLSSGGIVDADSYTFGGTTGTAVFSEEFIIEAGETLELEVRADTTSTADADDTIYFALSASNVTAEGETSGSTISTSDIIPSSITSKTMTVVASGLNHTVKTLNAVNVIAGSTGKNIHKSEVKASTASDIRITAVTFEDNTGTNSYFTDNDITEAKLIINDSVVKTRSGDISEAGGNNTLTFNGLNYTVPAGTTYTMYLQVSFASTKTGTTAFNIEVDTITAKDSDSDSVSVTEDTTSGPTVTVYSTGVLDITGSNTETDAKQDIHVTGGAESGFLGAFKFDARFEDVKVKDFTIFVEDDANIGDSIESVELVSYDQSTVIGTTSQFASGNYDGDADTADLLVTFEDLDYVVGEAGVETVYVRYTAKEMGNGAEQTATSGESVAFAIYGAGLDVVGNESGNTITMSGDNAPDNSDTDSEYEQDYTTNDSTIYGVTVTSVTNDLSNGFLTNGQSVIGKYKITIDSGNNTTSTGTATSFNFEDVVVTFSYSGIDTDGSSAGDADFYYYLASDPSTIVTITDFTDGDTSDDVDLSGLSDFTGTDTLVIEAAQISGAGAAGDYMQTRLASIDDGDFEWGDGISTTVAGTKLSYTNVAGGTLSN